MAFLPRRHEVLNLRRSLTLFVAVATAAIAVVGLAAPAGRWEKDIRAFEQADRQSPPPKGCILFLGSSSIRGWKTLQRDYPDLPVVNRGFGGSMIADSTRYADRIVIPYRPRQIVFYAGDNDIASGHRPEQLLADFQAFVEKIQSALPRTRILYVSIKPSPSRWKFVDSTRCTNELIFRYCRRTPGLDYVDVFTAMLGPDGQPRQELFLKDNLHMNAAGYALWTRLICPHLR